MRITLVPGFHGLPLRGHIEVILSDTADSKQGSYGTKIEVLRDDMTSSADLRVALTHHGLLECIRHRLQLPIL